MKCRRDPSRFNSVILGRDGADPLGNRGYWSRQREIARSVVDYPITLAPTGNAVGKSHCAAGIIHWFAVEHPGSKVVVTAPSQTQLEEVLWKEVESAYSNSRVPLGGRILKDPLKIEFGNGWDILAYSTTKVERFSGHHKEDLLAVVDEASGVADEIFEAIGSLNPSRELYLGNPLRPDGTFYERCIAAPSNPLANLIQVSSLESPHIELERSPWGLADATWLFKNRNDYGEGTLWWTTHVLGLFPDSGMDTVLPWSWLQLAAQTIHRPAGERRLAIDLAEGKGGDKSVVAAKDENGLLALKWSTTWSFEATATQAATVCQRFSIPGHNVSWDVGGIGADFANRLEAVGIVGARPYRGGNETGKKFFNLRSAAAWKLRQRLDPKRLVITDGGVAVPQVPFRDPSGVARRHAPGATGLAVFERRTGPRVPRDQRGLREAA